MVDLSMLIGSLRDGGAERIAAEVFENLPTSLTSQLVTIYSDNNYSVHRKPQICFNFPKENRVLKRNLFEKIVDLIKFYLNAYTQYKNLLIKNNVKLSFSFLQRDNLINIFVSLRLHKKFIISERNYPLPPEYTIYNKFFDWIVYFIGGNLASKIICNSYGVKRRLAHIYHINPNKIVVIYNPKDIDKIHNQMYEPMNNPFFEGNTPIIITSGRLVEQKGQWHLLRVFAALQEKIPSKLVICGIGPLETYLHNLAENLNISEKVLFTGWCNNPHKYVHNSSIFVFPSIHEAQPNALIEALICGCPVISTDCDYGPREILGDNEYGILSAKLDLIKLDASTPLSESEIALLNNIQLLLLDEKRRLHYIEKGLERGKMFSKDILLNKYYDTIVNTINQQ